MAAPSAISLTGNAGGERVKVGGIPVREAAVLTREIETK